MTSNTDALLASIAGGPVLDPNDLAAAFVDATHTARVGDIRHSMDRKPGPRIPPRYESEVRTWLARVTLEDDPPYSRIQAYAALHLDPNNQDAIAALDDACKNLGDEIRASTWSAIVHSYPDVKSVRNAAAAAGLPLPDSDMQRQAARKAAARRRGRRADDPVLVETEKQERPRKSGARQVARSKAVGIASLVPALEPDPVTADRLTVLHIVSGLEWAPPPGADDLLSLAVRSLDSPTVALPDTASGTATLVTLLRHEDSESRGPSYGKLLRRMKNHPAVVAWAVRGQLSDGDVSGARFARSRLDTVPAVWTAEFAAVDDLLAIAGGDLDAGWAAWQTGTLPGSLRPSLARALQEAGRERDADEVLGLPDVSPDDIDDPVLLGVRFDLLFLDGDADGALAQARRATILRLTPETVPRLWLGLWANGRLDELAGRMHDDAEAAGITIERAIEQARSIQEKRVRTILTSVFEDVTESRAALQELAKGRTIRDEEAFRAALTEARERLDKLDSEVELLEAPRPGRYPTAAEDLVSFLAAGAGLSSSLQGNEVVVEEGGVSGADLPGVSEFFAPARELVARGEAARSLVRRARTDLDMAEEQGAREDVPRRRVEERVARYARSAADSMSALLAVLDVFSPAPDIGPDAPGSPEEDAVQEGDGDGSPDENAPETVVLPGVGELAVEEPVEIEAALEAEVETAAERATEAELDDEALAEADDDGGGDPGSGRWFRRRR